MCTITFTAHNNKAFITHSRDESALRAIALPPAKYNVSGATLVYPKDAGAGGTWIAMNENGNTAVLMNGGFTAHIPRPAYRKSRGIVLLDIVVNPKMPAAFMAMNLTDIAPFTVILYDGNELVECTWDGVKKYSKKHDAGTKHIWSSATLYDPGAIAERKAWFDSWQEQHPFPSRQNLIGFHLHGGKGNLHNGIRMNRSGHLLTVSITSIQITAGGASMKYFDLQHETASEQALQYIQHPVAQ